MSKALISFGWGLLVLAGLAFLGGVMGAIWVTVSGAGSGGVPPGGVGGGGAPVGQSPVLAGIVLLYGFMGALWFGVVAAVVGGLGTIIGRLDSEAGRPR